MIRRTTLYDWHRRLGAALGLLLFVIMSSGTLAVLGNEWDLLLGPGEPSVNAPGTSVDAPVDWARVEAAIKEAVPLGRLELVSHAPGRPIRAGVFSVHDQALWVDVQPSGELIRVRPMLTIQVFLRQFHKALLIPSGLYVVTLCGFFLLFSAVSGLLVYKSWWRNLFRLRVLSKTRVLWADIHRTFGVWTFVFGILIGLTGVWYFAEAFSRSAFDETVEPPPPHIEPTHRRTRSLAELVDTARQELPDLQIRGISFGHDPESPARVDGQRRAWLVRDRANRVYIHPVTGEVLSVWREETQSLLHRWSDMADPLHFGDFGGIASKLIWFVLGLGLTLVVLAGPVLGYLRAPEMRRPSRRVPGGRGRRGGALVHVGNVLTAFLVSASSVLAALSTSLPMLGGRAVPDAVAEIEHEGARILITREDEESRVELRALALSEGHPPRAEVVVDAARRRLPYTGPRDALRDAPVEVLVGEQRYLTRMVAVRELPASRLKEALLTPPLELPAYVGWFVILFFLTQGVVIFLWVYFIGGLRVRRESAKEMVV